MPEQPKRKTPYDPIWKEDFYDLRFLSKPAFIIRQILRVYRNFDTSLSDISDKEIRKITGLNRRTIKTSIDELCQHGYITRFSYHVYFIRPFERYDFHEDQFEDANLLPKKDKTGYKANAVNFKKSKLSTSCAKFAQPVA